MIYKQETIGYKEGFALVLLATIPRITTISMVGMARSGQIAWLEMMMNGLGAVMILVMFNKIYSLSNCQGDLHHLAQQVLGKYLSFFTTLLIFFIALSNTILLLRQYGEDTINTALPHIDLEISVWLYLIVAAIAVHFGLAGISMASRLFLPVLVVAFLMIGFYLYPFWIPYRLFPWQGTLGVFPAIKDGLLGATYNISSILIFIWLPYFANRKTAFKAGIRGVIFTEFLKMYLMVNYLMTFGIEAGGEKVMPFYELSRLIYLSRYFQHIEAFLILFWVIVGVLGIALHLYLAVYLFCRLFQLEDGRVVLLLLTFCIGTLALLPEDFGKAMLLDEKYIFLTTPAGYGIPILLLIVQFFKQYWQQRKSQISQ